MLRKPERPIQAVSRRVMLAVGARIVAFGAVCVTIGSTIVAACGSETKPRTGTGYDARPDSGSGYGSSHGSGYGH